MKIIAVLSLIILPKTALCFQLKRDHHNESAAWSKFFASAMENNPMLRRCSVTILFWNDTQNWNFLKNFSYEFPRGVNVQNYNATSRSLKTDPFCMLTIVFTTVLDLNQLLYQMPKILTSKSADFYFILASSDQDDFRIAEDNGAGHQDNLAPNCLLALESNGSVSIFSMLETFQPKVRVKVGRLVNIWTQYDGYLDKIKALSLPEPGTYTRKNIRVARPTSSALQFFGLNDSCLHHQCGFDIYLVEYIASKLGKTINYITCVDDYWGALIDARTNSFNGMIGMLQRQEADLAVGSIVISGPRLTVADFSVPYYETGAGFIANTPRELSKWAALLRPYKTNSWIPIVMAILWSGPFLWFFTIWYPQPLSIPESFQACCKIFLNQEIMLQEITKGKAITSFLIGWILFSFIIFNAYKGSLISSLTSPALSPPLDTFKDLLSHSDDIRIMTQPNTATESFMRGASNPYLKKLQRISDETGQNVDYDLATSIQLVLNTTNTVYFQDMAYFNLMLKPPSGQGLDNPDVYLSKETFLQSGYGLPCIRGSPLQNLMNKLIIRSRSFGLDKRWLLMADLEQREKRRLDQLSEKKAQLKKEEHLTQFTLDHLQGIFYIYLMAIIICNVIFIGEICSAAAESFVY